MPFTRAADEGWGETGVVDLWGTCTRSMAQANVAKETFADHGYEVRNRAHKVVGMEWGMAFCFTSAEDQQQLAFAVRSPCTQHL